MHHNFDVSCHDFDSRTYVPLSFVMLVLKLPSVSLDFGGLLMVWSVVDGFFAGRGNPFVCRLMSAISSQCESTSAP